MSKISGKNHPKFIDLTNKIVGNLTILQYVLNPNEGSCRWVWKCQCSCGGVCFVRTTALTRNKPQKSCKKCSDTFASERRILDDFLSLRNRIYRRYKKGALDREYSFELSFENMESLIYKNCYYCNQEPQSYSSDDQYKNGRGIFRRNGIDRLDNNLGYSLDNCVTCCAMCNTMKMDTSYEDFINKIHQIYSHHIEKSSTTIEKVSD